MTIERKIDQTLDLDVALRGDMGCRAAGMDQIDDEAGVTTAMWDHVIDVNLKGSFFGDVILDKPKVISYM